MLRGAPPDEQTSPRSATDAFAPPLSGQPGARSARAHQPQDAVRARRRRRYQRRPRLRRRYQRRPRLCRRYQRRPRPPPRPAPRPPACLPSSRPRHSRRNDVIQMLDLCARYAFTRLEELTPPQLAGVAKSVAVMCDLDDTASKQTEPCAAPRLQPHEHQPIRSAGAAAQTRTPSPRVGTDRPSGARPSAASPRWRCTSSSWIPSGRTTWSTCSAPSSTPSWCDLPAAPSVAPVPSTPFALLPRPPMPGRARALRALRRAVPRPGAPTPLTSRSTHHLLLTHVGPISGQVPRQDRRVRPHAGAQALADQVHAHHAAARLLGLHAHGGAPHAGSTTGPAPHHPPPRSQSARARADARARALGAVRGARARRAR